jgi:thymidylate synthase
MNKLDKQYQDLLQDILENGITKSDRTGTGTISVFGRQIRHNLNDGFPLLTTKKMAIKTMMTELKWFLKGDTNIKYLVDNGCKIWNGDAYKKYLDTFTETFGTEGEYDVYPLSESEFIEEIKTDDKFAEQYGELGPIYGKQWTDWNGIDQILNLINSLKKNPDSRRLMVNAWNVGEIHEMTLPPCHYGFQCYVSDLSPLEIIDQAKKDGLWKDTIPEGMTLGELQKDFKTKKLSLMWNQRSVDTFLGLPFNISSYAMLLHLLAKEVNMVPDEIIGNLGDTHLYSNHIEQAKEQISREPMEFLPKLKLNNVDILSGEFDYEILHYHSHPTIKAPLSN